MATSAEALLETVRREAAATPGLGAAYVFGSAVRDLPRARDLDLALLWDAAVTPERRWAGAEDLARRIEIAQGPDALPVDLVELEGAPPALLHRILSEGRLVFEGNRERRVRFQAVALSMALDFLEWQRPFLERWREVVAGGR